MAPLMSVFNRMECSSASKLRIFGSLRNIKCILILKARDYHEETN